MSYDPSIGRWTAQDPIAFKGGDANLYRYVSNSPTNFTDPSGLAPKDHDRYSDVLKAILANGGSEQALKDLLDLAEKSQKYFPGRAGNCQIFTEDFVKKSHGSPGIRSINVTQFGNPYGLLTTGHSLVEVTLNNGSVFYIDNGGTAGSTGKFRGQLVLPSDIPSYWVPATFYPTGYGLFSYGKDTCQFIYNNAPSLPWPFSGHQPIVPAPDNDF
jgi:uncharacterized protein RhaS with RHS repeats